MATFDVNNIPISYLGVSKCIFGTTGVIVKSNKNDFKEDDK